MLGYSKVHKGYIMIFEIADANIKCNLYVINVQCNIACFTDSKVLKSIYEPDSHNSRIPFAIQINGVECL